MDKFYTVHYWSDRDSGPINVQKNIKDLDAALRIAKKTAVEYRADTFISTTTHLVQAPVPEATVTAIT